MVKVVAIADGSEQASGDYMRRQPVRLSAELAAMYFGYRIQAPNSFDEPCQFGIPRSSKPWFDMK
jgi:hypothetical protein